MLAELDKSDLFELADTLGIELKRDKTKLTNQLSGSVVLEFKLMEGLTFGVTPTIVDSGVYTVSAVAGVVVHVCGALYAVLLIDANLPQSEYLSLWLVDGTKLGWSAKSFNPVFPMSWSRAVLEGRIREGVIAGYRRTSTGSKWAQIPDPKSEMVVPIQGEASDMTFALSGSSEITTALSDRFRTKGPRGV